MFFWTPYAFVRIVAVLLAGILLGIYQPDLVPEPYAAVFFIVLTLGFLLLVFTGKQPVNLGFIGLTAVFLAGYLNTLHNTESRYPDHLLNVDTPVKGYHAVIRGYPEEKPNSWKSEARIQAVYDGEQWITCSGKIILYFSKKDFATPYQYGDVLFIKGAPQLLNGPANPGEFDYRRFLSFRKIYHQHFLRRDYVTYAKNDPPYELVSLSMTVRSWAGKQIRKHIDGEKEQAVASALLLGVRDGLDNDLVHAYSSSGAMHVLAVSGLHVGIIYLILTFFLKPLRNWKHGKWTIAIVSVLVLWSYAFITGLSASVLRAVTMFSFMAVARPLAYSTNIFNTLAVAAFCLLMWEPYLLMSVGFQLSFLAVLGIVYLQPKLYRLWEPTGWIWDKTWQITCVSISAQAATFALGILYFHQFPVYFLVSNLFVIPGALFSLTLGILLLAVSPVAFLADLAGLLFNAILKALNYLVFTVDKLPFSLIDNIYITTFQSWTLLGMVIAVILLVEFRRFRYVFVLAGCCFGFGITKWWHHLRAVDHARLVVYQVNGHSALEWVNRGQSFFITDSALLNDRERIRFHIRPNRLIHGIGKVHAGDHSFIREFDGSRLYVFRDCKLLQFTSASFSVPHGLEVDYLVVSNNSIDHFKRISSMKVGTLILDGSNAAYLSERLMQDAAKAGMNVHSTVRQGAFVAKL